MVCCHFVALGQSGRVTGYLFCVYRGFSVQQAPCLNWPLAVSPVVLLGDPFDVGCSPGTSWICLVSNQGPMEGVRLTGWYSQAPLTIAIKRLLHTCMYISVFYMLHACPHVYINIYICVWFTYVCLCACVHAGMVQLCICIVGVQRCQAATPWPAPWCSEVGVDSTLYGVLLAASPS